MFSAKDLEVLRDKHVRRRVPWLFQHLKRCFVIQQQDEVKLTALTDDQAEALSIQLPAKRRHDPTRVRWVVLRHHQWPAVQEELEARGFAVTISAQHITVKIAPAASLATAQVPGVAS